jgi:coenzyme Q-binding protein COQ10
MPTHAEIRVVPYSVKQMYDLVADVERYPEFLPWCIACRISKKKENEVFADLILGYKIFRETISSHVILDPYKKIDVKYESGPLHYLNNHWKFKPIDEHSCEVDFYVDFAFHNSFFQHAMELFFNEAVKILIHSFEKRAAELYGTKQ